MIPAVLGSLDDGNPFMGREVIAAIGQASALELNRREPGSDLSLGDGERRGANVGKSSRVQGLLNARVVRPRQRHVGLVELAADELPSQKAATRSPTIALLWPVVVEPIPPGEGGR